MKSIDFNYLDLLTALQCLFFMYVYLEVKKLYGCSISRDSLSIGQYQSTHWPWSLVPVSVPSVIRGIYEAGPSVHCTIPSAWPGHPAQLRLLLSPTKTLHTRNTHTGKIHTRRAGDVGEKKKTEHAPQTDTRHAVIRQRFSIWGCYGNRSPFCSGVNHKYLYDSQFFARLSVDCYMSISLFGLGEDGLLSLRMR